ncbi:MAG: helix-turn-helix transcriptional regulator [Bacteroidetes bacterium]|jgi:transcriptional regulator with XRE-family HTH domain|nr:helix-turn-helix transcriptional regulator [Bacteroidota bacterium]
MNIGKVIKAIRSDKNIKQKELSESCNISVTYLSQIENNKKEPALSTLEGISKYLGIPLPIIFFMSLEDNDIPPHKKEFFKHLHPSLNGLIKEFF